MRTFSGRLFRSRSSPAVWRTKIRDVELRNCNFMYCEILPAATPRCRPLVQDVLLIDSIVGSCQISTALIEDVVVDGLDTRGSGLWLYACAFRRVTVKGKVGSILIRDSNIPHQHSPKVEARYRNANNAFFAKVDWALDIAAANARAIQITGVPASLIRRDPESQVVVRRDKAEAGAWRGIAIEGIFQIALQDLLKRKAEDVVLVAPRQSPRFREYVADLELLRRIGVAEPD